MPVLRMIENDLVSHLEDRMPELEHGQHFVSELREGLVHVLKQNELDELRDLLGLVVVSARLDFPGGGLDRTLHSRKNELDLGFRPSHLIVDVGGVAAAESGKVLLAVVAAVVLDTRRSDRILVNDDEPILRLLDRAIRRRESSSSENAREKSCFLIRQGSPCRISTEAGCDCGRLRDKLRRESVDSSALIAAVVRKGQSVGIIG